MGPDHRPLLLGLEGVGKAFDGRTVLDAVTLSVRSGEVVSLIGRSGAGKSTLLRVLNGLTPFDCGTVRIGDQVLRPGVTPEVALRALRRRVGMVFQRFNLFPHLDVLANVSLAPRTVLGLGRRQAETLAMTMLERVGLADRGAAYPRQLSGGQQQRVAIARALAMSPQVLLCDEITSALDPELTYEVLEVIRRLAADGMTIVMATHEMRFAREASDQIAFLVAGRIHECGPAASLFRQPATPELARFLGAMGCDAPATGHGAPVAG